MKLPLENLKQEVFSIRDETTDSSYGRAPKDRSIEERINYGFILLDKPAGIRSKTAAYIAKKIMAVFAVKKIGYSGTLEN
ncbi:MAG: tRNA pseudouridine synthase A [Candidatus Parvarchaeota archaeon]|jgi:tRNA U55 pseudouridine synthase TruB|nr:tRNA pseudouridine synthase A [Candidatus Parvarchaeota archaeon]MCL5420627.1 tRNA pseudouridine synthase A [Candidatus Parvarchaeota archaeon]